MKCVPITKCKPLLLLTGGADYLGAFSILTFAPGKVQKFFDVAILDDDVLEDQEMFTAVLTTDDDISSDSSIIRVTIIDIDSKFCERNVMHCLFEQRA